MMWHILFGLGRFSDALALLALSAVVAGLLGLLSCQRRDKIDPYIKVPRVSGRDS